MIQDWELDRLRELFPGYEFERHGDGVRAVAPGRRTVTEPYGVLVPVLSERDWAQKMKACRRP